MKPVYLFVFLWVSAFPAHAGSADYLGAVSNTAKALAHGAACKVDNTYLDATRELANRKIDTYADPSDRDHLHMVLAAEPESVDRNPGKSRCGDALTDINLAQIDLYNLTESPQVAADKEKKRLGSASAAADAALTSATSSRYSPAPAANNAGGAILLVLLLAAVYFIPTVVATRRDHPNSSPIIAVNLFLGWTLVGWVVALAWSLAAIPQTNAEPALAPTDRSAIDQIERAAKLHQSGLLTDSEFATLKAQAIPGVGVNPEF